MCQVNRPEIIKVIHIFEIIKLESVQEQPHSNWK